MSPDATGGGRVRFGLFEADLGSGELFKDGRRVSLPNQSFLALSALLERPGQLVSRDTLKARLWPDNRVVEFEQGLNAIINRLREVLGDSAGSAKFIETLPRRGYRFVAAVEVLPTVSGPRGTVAANAASADAAQGVELPRVGETTKAQPRGLIAGVVAAVVGLLVLTVIILRHNVRSNGAASNAEVFSSAASNSDVAGDLRVRPLTSLVGRETSPAFSPDGQRLAFAWNGGTRGVTPEERRFDLYVKSLDSERTLQLTQQPALSIGIAWSRDGRQLAFTRTTDHDAGIYLVPSTGGTEKLLTSAVFLSEAFMQLSWSPDDRVLAYSTVEPNGRSTIRLLTLQGLESRKLDQPTSCADAGAPAFSPDGQRLAFLCASSLAVYGVYVTSLPSGTPRLLASLHGYPQGLAWAADGRALIVANDAADGSAVWRLSLDGKLARMSGAEEGIGPGVASKGHDVAFVQDKHLIDIWRVDLAKPTDSGRAVIASTRMQLVPQYSPDGARVAFQSTRSGSSEVWLADADGSNPVKLTSFNGPLTGAPSWCSDGRRVAFDSRASGISAIYIVDVFEGHPHRLETSAVNLSLPVWSQDCRWIFASNGRAKLYRIPASGGPAELFTEKSTYQAAVSGQHVVFNVTDAQGVELWTKPAQGGMEAPLEGMPHLSYADSWTATPNGIYYTRSAPPADTGAATAAGTLAASGAATPLRPAITPGTARPVGTATPPGAPPETPVYFYDFALHHARLVRRLSGTLEQLGGLGIAVSKDERWLLYTRTAEWESDIISISGLK